MVPDASNANPGAPDPRRLAMMIDSVSDAIVTIDSRGVIEYANRGAQELFGYRLEELLGRNVSLLMPQPDSRRHDGYIAAYLKTGQSRVMNHRRSVNGLRKDGSLVPLDLTLGQMLEHGEQKFTAVMRDVTEQRRLQQLAAEAERRLQEAKDRADEANRAKSVFLATMSHEIRTPMNGVLGSLELLGLTELNQSQHETVAMAEQSGRELLRLLDDILDFSKIEAGRLELRHERTALREQVIDKVLATYAPLALKKGLALRSSIAPSVAALVCTDPLRLRQILHNFVSNAVKFTLAGEIELSLQVLRGEADAQLLRFAVRDTGIGISAANQARLFQPFVQAEGDTTRRFGGTGLGLAICLGLADSMGGAIAMQSAPGAGTTMSLELRLPIPADAAPTPAARPPAAAAAGAASSAGAGALSPAATATGAEKPVLVVDDHATNRKVLLRQLAALGYAAESAVNGVEALRMLASGRHCLVISDCQMPEMDGYTLARTVRDDERRRGLPRLPMIAFTANAFATDAERAMQAGMDDYLAKPTTIASLGAMLALYLPLPLPLPLLLPQLLPAPAPAGQAPHPPAPPREPAPDAIDEALLAAIVGDDAAARGEFLADFLLSCQADAGGLQAAYQAGDLCSFMESAHRLCGAAKMVGAVRLAAACASIERAGRARLALADSGLVDADPLGAPVRQAYLCFQRELAHLTHYLNLGADGPENAGPQHHHEHR